MRNPLSFLAGFGLIAMFAVPAVLHFGAAVPQVYDKPDDFVVRRPAAVDGVDRILLTARVVKRLNCDVEAGEAAPYVSFHDGTSYVPPPAALTRGDGTSAGHTRGNAGDVFTIVGYSAVVPKSVGEKHATFVVKVPCRLWSWDATTGEKRWGDQVIAPFGPFQVPDVGGLAVDDAKAKLLLAGALRREELP